MDKDTLTKIINDTINTKMDSMTNMAVPNHYHNGWDANQLDPAIALIGFPVVQVADASVAPTDVPPNGTFRFYVDTTPTYYLWAFMNYASPAGTLTSAWKSIPLNSSGASVNGRSSGSGVTTIATGVNTKVTPTNDFATGITWDNTNKRFVVITPGNYMISAQVAYSSTTNGAFYYTRIYKNGASNSYGFFQGGSTAGGIGSYCITNILPLVANDYIELYTLQTSGGNEIIYNVAGITYLTINKI